MNITKICTAMGVNSQQNSDYGIHVDIDLHLPNSYLDCKPSTAIKRLYTIPLSYYCCRNTEDDKGCCNL